MQKLIPVDTAVEKITEYAQSYLLDDIESVVITEALYRVLAEDILAACDVPPCDNSAMDGYALCYKNLLSANNATLSVSQRVAAGEEPQPLTSGTVARIFTGAAIPAGADTVVMQENTEVLDNGAVKFAMESIQQGKNIRPQGQDVKVGQVIFNKGHVLKPQDLGVIASVGIASVKVLRRPVVAVVSTGDELIEPGQPLAVGQIYNSNRYLLTAQIQALGCEIVDGGIIPDNLEGTCHALSALADKVDLIISSGGVSVGEEDYIKPAVEQLGQLDLWKVKMKPGKPLAFGRINNTPFFGLPGNPASSFVTFILFVRPFLAAIQGYAVNDLCLPAKVTFDREKPGSREEYLRARVYNDNGQLIVEPYQNQSSGVLLSTSWANALLKIPADKNFKQGDILEVLLLGDLLRPVYTPL